MKYKLQQVPLLKNRSVFVDTNVLMYLFWPTGSYDYEKNYAKAFDRLLKQGNVLFVDFSVISELVNRVLRIEHNCKQPTAKFKDFRNSREGMDTQSDIFSIIKGNILPRFRFIEKAFNRHEVEAMLEVDKLDFIDKSVVATCKEKNLVLLTNDRDFKDTGIDILSGNPNV